jgi:phage shock protein PspC (stress-responsive transcriptional regulator)
MIPRKVFQTFNGLFAIQPNYFDINVDIVRVVPIVEVFLNANWCPIVVLIISP